MRKLVLSMALAAVSLFGADPSGKWTWEMQGRDGEKRTQTLNLQADGDKLSGTMAGRQGERPIADGKIAGDDISFSTTVQMGGESRKLLYKGKLSGDEIKLTMSSEGGEFSRDFVAKRAQ
jgi:hypothetical protein